MAARTTTRRAQGIQSVETGGTLLRALVADGGPMMLKDLAAAARMPAAKAHRYLVSLVRLGLVEQDEASGRYGLGAFALHMGLAALMRLDAVRHATPLLPELAMRLRATVAAAVWGSAGATIVRWEESQDVVTVNVRAGAVLPLLRSSTGRCFAAWLPPGATAVLMARELRRPAPGGPASRAALDRLLAGIRRDGVATVEGQLIPGIDAVSVPVFDHRGAIALVLTALGYSAGFDAAPDGRVARELRKAAAALSARLGAGVAPSLAPEHPA